MASSTNATLCGVALSPETRQAVRRYGPSINKLARRRYGISGQDLLAKLVYGESRDDPNAVSPAGARGRTQFMPSSRAEAIRKYGVDPWGSADDAVHAAVLHLKGKINGSRGLEGYNPGDPNYPKYILGQPVSGPGGRARPGAGGGQQTPSQGPALLPPGMQVQPGPDTSGLLASLLSDQPSAPPVGSLRPSATAASAALPQGYRGIQTQGGPAPRRDVSTLLEAVSGLGTALPGVAPGQVLGDAQNGGKGSERNPHGGKSAPAGVTGGRGKIIGTPHTGTHTLGNWQSDNAVDVRVPEGSAIRAGADGTVVKVSGSYSGGADRFDGYQVTIRTRGNQLFYTHLSAASVKPGQKVRRGQVLGRSGAANGVPHLHLGVAKGDPRRYV